MMEQEKYRELISGRTKGLVALFLRFILTIAAIGYQTAIKIRNLLYDRGLLKPKVAKAVVISIGNITAGGTGKTPLVTWLCDLIAKKNIKCAILTRGYKTKQGELSDEPAQLAKNCPGFEVVVNPDRTAGAAKAIKDYNAKILIMDDGFQHRRLSRDLDIVTIDATNPFGFGKTLPAGLLREPLKGLKRADAAVITRTDQVSPEKLISIEAKLRYIKLSLILARATHTPESIIGPDGQSQPVDQFRDKKVFAFCGIGNPEAFFTTLEKLNITQTGREIFNDHHSYTDDDIAEIRQKAAICGAELILTTEKDFGKIVGLIEDAEQISFAYLAVTLEIIAGKDKITQLIESRLQ